MPRAVSKGWAGARQQARKSRPIGALAVPGDVLACLAELGVSVDRMSGDEAIARCPGHLSRIGKVDGDPSWSVNVNSGMHNCFACGFKGPFAAIVREVLGVSDSEAVTWVRSRGSLERVERLLTGGYIDELVKQVKKPVTEADLALFVPPPQDVLRTRGISIEAAATYGVLYDTEADTWITPIREPGTGSLWGWQEKAVDGRFFRNRPRHIEKSLTLFGLDQIRAERRAIIIESPLDACVVETAGWRGACSSFGAGVSDAQMQLVLEHCDSAILALDNDPDGRKQTERVLQQWGPRLPLKVMPYLYGCKDPGEMTNSQINECLRKSEYPYWKRNAHR